MAFAHAYRWKLTDKNTCMHTNKMKHKNNIELTIQMWTRTTIHETNPPNYHELLVRKS